MTITTPSTTAELRIDRAAEVTTAIEWFASGTSSDSGATSPADDAPARPSQQVIDAVEAYLKETLSTQPGFVAGMLLSGLQGELAVYSHWATAERPVHFPSAWSVALAVGELTRRDGRTFEVDFSAPLASSAASLFSTPHAHFGLFAVKPDNQERMLELARHNAPNSIGTPGLTAINFHRSLDGERVVNLGLWTGFSGFDNLHTRAGFNTGAKYWEGVAKFRSHFYDVAAIVTA
ncbi:hypothetical protein GCM10009745_70720 [Kribbella yunnanensis]|uniref:ABM domain-containing protein n=1 Tax=Kribbella yunnanensis TaxID=190194 RepID=A0ABP4UV40_9ACTN